MNRFKAIATRGDTPVLALAVVTGFLVALLIAGFETLADSVVLEHVKGLSRWQVIFAPGIGLILAHLILRYLGNKTSPATSDEFVRAFHDRTPRLPIRDLPAKLLAGVTTIGFGGSLGLEGPSIYAGSVTGLAVRDRFKNWLRKEDIKI